jgi:hypothetical protein
MTAAGTTECGVRRCMNIYSRCEETKGICMQYTAISIMYYILDNTSIID